MSFKRDGNDFAMLRNLQKARVSSLLGSGIPEDNVKLLNDGRLTCLVCLGQHVFDNVSILKIHRNTAKHKSMLEIFEKKKRSTLALIEKRIETCRLKGEDSSALVEKKRELLTSRICYRTKQPSPRCYPINADVGINQNGRKSASASTNRKSASASTNRKSASASTQIACLEAVTKTRKVEVLEKNKRLDAEERREQREEDLRMYSQGWKKDSWGKWVKDPEVEFDSDDD